MRSSWGLCIYTVGTTYDEADLNVDHEANAVAGVYRLAERFSQPQATQIAEVGAVVCRDRCPSRLAADGQRPRTDRKRCNKLGDVEDGHVRAVYITD
jgi:hypothetical protein